MSNIRSTTSVTYTQSYQYGNRGGGDHGRGRDDYRGHGGYDRDRWDRRPSYPVYPAYPSYVAPPCQPVYPQPYYPPQPVYQQPCYPQPVYPQPVYPQPYYPQPYYMGPAQAVGTLVGGLVDIFSR